MKLPKKKKAKTSESEIHDHKLISERYLILFRMSQRSGD